MSRRIKLFTSLSTVALSSALVLSACGGEGEGGEGAGGKDGAHAVGGESESGESEGGVIKEEKSDFVAQLILIRGHLRAGTTLYEAGELEMAARHMKHPQDELYADLLSLFDKFGAEGFEDELNALSSAVEAGEPSDIVATRFGEVRIAVGDAIKAADLSTKELLLSFSKVLHIAGEEFDIGVTADGEISNLHEYQDAFGFMLSVVEILTGMEVDTPEELAAVAAIREQAMLALSVAPSPLPEAPIVTKSTTIFGAAARIEIVALGL